MAGIGQDTADIALRERFAFGEARAARVLAGVRGAPGVRGAVLLCTCNRTELYLSLENGGEVRPAALLAEAAGANGVEAACLREAEEEAAARHLFAVASGLRAAVPGDDQILTQTREALEQAREARVADAALETLFRCALTAAKRVKTELRVGAPDASAAQAAAALLAARLPRGAAVLVVGSGVMGREAAKSLLARGFAVTMTLRTRHPGETVVPAGCRAVAYEARGKAAARADAVLSATRSPHFTFTADMLAALPAKKRQVIDLAVPRDIEPAAAALPGIVYENIDTIHAAAPLLSAADKRRLDDIFARAWRDFSDWRDGRTLRETARLLKADITARVAADLQNGQGGKDPAAYAVGRTVDILLFALKRRMNPALEHALRAALSPPAREKA